MLVVEDGQTVEVDDVDLLNAPSDEPDESGYNDEPPVSTVEDDLDYSLDEDDPAVLKNKLIEVERARRSFQSNADREKARADAFEKMLLEKVQNVQTQAPVPTQELKRPTSVLNFMPEDEIYDAYSAASDSDSDSFKARIKYEDAMRAFDKQELLRTLAADREQQKQMSRFETDRAQILADEKLGITADEFDRELVPWLQNPQNINLRDAVLIYKRKKDKLPDVTPVDRFNTDTPGSRGVTPPLKKSDVDSEYESFYGKKKSVNFFS